MTTIADEQPPVPQHPREIRRQAQALGLRWDFAYLPHQSAREMTRRRRQRHLCDAGCGLPRFGSSKLLLGLLGSGLRERAGMTTDLSSLFLYLWLSIRYYRHLLRYSLSRSR